MLIKHLKPILKFENNIILSHLFNERLSKEF